MEATEKKFFNVPGRAIMYRNFEGTAGPYNKEGDRSFCLGLDDETAELMKDEGWNVRYKVSKKDPDAIPVPYIQIKVEFRKGRPPKMVQFTKNGKTVLEEEDLKNLDWADIDKADVCINPYKWTRLDGSTGISAYLKKMNIFLEDDDFEDRTYEDAYADEAPFDE